MAISLGVYMEGEVSPRDIVYTFLDSAGTAINVTGHTVKAEVTAPDRTVSEVEGQVDNGSGGVVSIPWEASMTDAPGPWQIIIWVQDDPTALASTLLVYTVAPASVPS